MVDVIITMIIGMLIGAFGVVAWCLHESGKDKGGKDE